MSKLLIKRIAFIIAVVAMGIIYFVTMVKGSRAVIDQDTSVTLENASEQQKDEVIRTEETKEEVVEDKKENTDEEVIYIHVCGAVKQPGVYGLSINDRVIDAVLTAGGFLDTAAQDAINQAELLVDGAKLYIPTTEELDRLGYEQEEQGKTTKEQYGLVEGNRRQIDDKININTAGKEALMTLPGIGEAKAESILAYREEHGNFKTVDELQKVPGIKEASFKKMKDYITVAK